MKNPYLPAAARIQRIVTETEDRNIKSFDLSFMNKADQEDFRFVPGQFAEISISGKGEAPFGIASSPTEKEFLRFSVNRAGVVTTALHNLEEGEIVPMEKVRTREKAIDKLIEFVAEFSRIDQIAIVQSPSRAGKDTRLLIDRLESNFPGYDFSTFTYGPTLGTHIGPYGLGLIVYEGTV